MSARFALFGHPAGHSLSGVMHAASFAAIGYDGTYEVRDVPPDVLADAFRDVREAGYRGLNITVPHKTAIRALLDETDEAAERWGAVNTVVFDAEGRSKGFNTDGPGFLAALATAGVMVEGAHVLVLGSGGAGRVLAKVCAEQGCETLTVANRTVREGVVSLTGEDCCVAAADADLIVNATSLGLKEEDASPIPVAWIRPGAVVCDIAAMRHETQFLRAARVAGLKTVDGLEMLVQQGAASFRLWTGCEPDVESMRRAIKR